MGYDILTIWLYIIYDSYMVNILIIMVHIWYIYIWLVVESPTPLKNDGVKVSWYDYSIPNWMESHNPVMFQSPPPRSVVHHRPFVVSMDHLPRVRENAIQLLLGRHDHQGFGTAFHQLPGASRSTSCHQDMGKKNRPITWWILVAKKGDQGHGFHLQGNFALPLPSAEKLG